VSAAPDTRYTRSADGTNVAYQVSGEGPFDLVFRTGGIPIDSCQRTQGSSGSASGWTPFSPTVWFDHRGLGASEGDPHDSFAEEIFEADLTAMLDAVGSERPVLLGEDVLGVRMIKFSVTHPERVDAPRANLVKAHKDFLPGLDCS
jgi:pimeloyl-ACP methyl ester carboxylesterase